jgi:hypothetical protein
MLVMAVMTGLCTAGIAFYVRFLVALGGECKPRWIGYWMRLRLDARQSASGERQERQRATARAA